MGGNYAAEGLAGIWKLSALPTGQARIATAGIVTLRLLV
jgi:hypothetical protein